jgi:Cu2+-exporting ATPase
MQGFPARVRPSESDLSDEAEKADARKAEELQRSLLNLGVAWGLALLCCTHHVGHWLHALGYHGLAHGSLMTAMGNPWISGALGAFALLGPGRTLVRDGAVSLYR